MTTAQANEANGGTVAIVVDDTLTVTVPASVQDWPVAAMEGFEDGKVVSALRAILGPEQWEKFMSTPRTLRDLNALAERLAGESGMTVGE